LFFLFTASKYVEQSHVFGTIVAPCLVSESLVLLPGLLLLLL
jgi:hypothetical protein